MLGLLNPTLVQESDPRQDIQREHSWVPVKLSSQNEVGWIQPTDRSLPAAGTRPVGTNRSPSHLDEMQGP